jgi:hypothetical protein
VGGSMTRPVELPIKAKKRVKEFFHRSIFAC